MYIFDLYCKYVYIVCMPVTVVYVILWQSAYSIRLYKIKGSTFKKNNICSFLEKCIGKWMWQYQLVILTQISHQLLDDLPLNLVYSLLTDSTGFEYPDYWTEKETGYYLEVPFTMNGSLLCLQVSICEQGVSLIRSH